MGKLLIAALVMFTLASCQKEISMEAGSGSTSDSLLYKVITDESGTKDSTVFLYTASRKFSGLIATGSISPRLADADLSLTRNTSGMITSYTNSDGTSSVTFTVNSNNNRYTYKTATFSISGETVKDSIVYQYDAAGKIGVVMEYIQADALGYPFYVLFNKYEYSYSSNDNIAKITVSSIDFTSGAITKFADEILTYDTKKSPLKLGTEAIVLEQEGFYSSNNAIKLEIAATDPANNDTVITTFTYNSSNKPVTSTAIVTSTGDITKFTYIYK